MSLHDPLTRGTQGVWSVGGTLTSNQGLHCTLATGSSQHCIAYHGGGETTNEAAASLEPVEPAALHVRPQHLLSPRIRHASRRACVATPMERYTAYQKFAPSACDTWT